MKFTKNQSVIWLNMSLKAKNIADFNIKKYIFTITDFKINYLKQNIYNIALIQTNIYEDRVLFSEWVKEDMLEPYISEREKFEQTRNNIYKTIERLIKDQNPETINIVLPIKMFIDLQFNYHLNYSLREKSDAMQYQFGKDFFTIISGDVQDICIVSKSGD